MLMPSSIAKLHLNHLHQSPVMIALMQEITTHPELLKDADTQARLVFKDPTPESRQEYAADLIMTDIIDQVHFYLNKRRKKNSLKTHHAGGEAT